MVDNFKQRIKGLVNRNQILVKNFSYITVLRVLILVAPLITYPYLTRILGLELYGLVITAQVLASYALLLVQFSFDSVSAKHISINRDDRNKLSEVVFSILFIRFRLWIISFIIYVLIVLLIPLYREHFLLFLFSFGVTLNVLLFPQFVFQGLEDMKYITIFNVVIQIIFIVLIFVFVKEASDYFLVPLFHTVGYLIGGIASLYIIFCRYNIPYKKPTRESCSYYFKDALPLFATDAICTIKNQFNYLLLGGILGTSQVVVYDIGSKITQICMVPINIINTVIYPKMARTRNNIQFKRIGMIILYIGVLMLFLVNVFLEPIVNFLVGGQNVPLLPVRIFTLSPLILAISGYICMQFFVARGYNKYVLNSIIITTIAYLVLLGILYITSSLTNVMSFVILTVVSYLVELVYRIFVVRKLI